MSHLRDTQGRSATGELLERVGTAPRQLRLHQPATPTSNTASILISNSLYHNVYRFTLYYLKPEMRRGDNYSLFKQNNKYVFHFLNIVILGLHSPLASADQGSALKTKEAMLWPMSLLLLASLISNAFFFNFYTTNYFIHTQIIFLPLYFITV